MIWFLTIALPLLAAVITPLIPARRRSSGLVPPAAAPGASGRTFPAAFPGRASGHVPPASTPGRGMGLVFLAATIPALWLGLVEEPGVTAQWFLLGSDFSLDTPRRIILLLTAILWATAGLFADSYLKDDARRGEFAFYFGAAMAGNFGLLISAEVTAFYTFFALMTFASYGLVIHSRTPAARQAAKIYLVMAIIGELFLITAFYLAVHSAGSFLLADLPAALAVAPNGRFIFLLGLIGFGVKVGAIPLYFWLPLAHPAAPAPASAVLSGAMIKAGLVGWMHLAPVGLVEWPGMSMLLVGLGFAAALGAAIYGLTQIDPKTILAYSSISQMGVMTVLLGIGLYGGIQAGLLLTAIALYAFNHGTAKALLFMGTALPAKVGGSWRILMWAGLGMGVLAIAGGPLTGGLWTKYMFKTFLGATNLPGADIFLLLLTLSAITTTLLLSRFLHLLHRIKAPSKKVAPAFLFPWLLLLLAGGWLTMTPALLPTELLNYITKEKGMMAFFWNLSTNWNALWPIAVGLMVLVLSLKFASLNKWSTKKPLLPAGDFIHIILLALTLLEKLLRKGIAWLETGLKSVQGPEKIFYSISDDKRTSQFSAAAESLLRRWEFVGIGFLIFFLALILLIR